MKIDVCLVPQEATEERTIDRAVAVVDVLRASTSIQYALHNGARAVIPVESVANAMEKAHQFERELLLLCGEREGKKVAGFDLGNSPAEYSAETVKGKNLIYTSTNGSRMLFRTHGAKTVSIASFTNLSAAVRQLHEMKCDVTIICSGKFDKFSLEDAVCAGVLVEALTELEPGATYTDGALAALALSQQYSGDIGKMLAECSHGIYLTSLGMGSDIALCAEVDRFDRVPLFYEGTIK